MAKPFDHITYTVTNHPSFTWPLVQPKPSWWRRLLRWLHAR